MRDVISRAFALFTIASFFVTTVSAVSVSVEDGGTSDRDALAVGPEATGSLLDLVGNLTRIDSIGTEGPPVQSHVLGVSLPPQFLPARYVQEAGSHDRPLREALLTWNDALTLQDPDRLAEDPELEQADALPRDVQVAVAALLYALTDATMLQADALEALDEDERAMLLALPDALLAAGGDPQDWMDDPHMASLMRVGAKVDLAPIRAGTQIIMATTTRVLPTLESWQVIEQESMAQMEAPLGDLEGFLDIHSPERLRVLHPIERIDAFTDALLLARSWTFGDTALGLAPIEPDADTDLVGLLLRLERTLQGFQDPATLEAHLRVQSAALPEGLQTAIARIVLNQQAWVEAFLQDPGGPGTITAAVRLANAVQRSAPTMEAYGLLYSHHAYPQAPKTPAHAAAAIHDQVRIAGALVDGRSDASSAVHVGFIAQGADPMAVKVPPLPPRGSLEDAVLDLYDRLGLEVDDATRDTLHEDVMALAPTVERHVARLLQTQLDATDTLSALYQSLTQEELRLLADGTTPVHVQNRIREGEVTLSDLRSLEVYYGLVDHVRSSYYEASLQVTTTMTDTRHALADYTRTQMEWEIGSERLGWRAHALAFLELVFPPSAMAQSGGDPCQTDPRSPECSDILFIDPTASVIIGGFGTTYYEADLSGLDGGNAQLIVPTRGQVLTLDLGGDDIYRNNAGGSVLTLQWSKNPSTITGTDAGTFVVDPTAVATALDLGGDDVYDKPRLTHPFSALPRSDDLLEDVIQGASAGGIGILWDVGGNDQYTARSMAQGSGGGLSHRDRPDAVRCSPPVPAPALCMTGLFGVGLLIDDAGNDQYTAHDRSQGAATMLLPPNSSVVSFMPQNAVGGVGMLIDRSGDDQYQMTFGAHGQGDGDTGIGMLIDGSGDDDYFGASQGQGRGGGLGVLVDAEGDDSFSRRNVYTGVEFQDGRCRASFHQGDTFALQAPGFGLFADLQSGECWFNPFHTLSDLPDTDPGALADLVLGNLGQAGEYAGRVLSFEDTDGDGWADGAEVLASTDPLDAEDHPGRLTPQKPQDWPEDVPHPSETGFTPSPSPALLRVPGVIVVGDATDTVYPASPGPRTMPTDAFVATLPQGDHLITLDLGGEDDYQNRVGGPLRPLSATSYLEDALEPVGGGSTGQVIGQTVDQSQPHFPTVAVDFGSGGDFYNQSQTICVQGCDSLLFDLGGDDRYEAYDQAQGMGETGVGGIFDAGGDDRYVITMDGSMGQGSASVYAGWVPSIFPIGLLVDAGGQDVYASATQGTSRSPSPGGATGLFFDLEGADHYQPVGDQGIAVGSSISNSMAVFVDNDGTDSYVGRPEHPTRPDFSIHRNDRLDVRGPDLQRGSSLDIFWDRNTRSGSHDTSPSPHLFMPGLGVAVATACEAFCDTTWDQDMALLIDPAGDDTYRNNAGATLLRTTVATDSGPDGITPGLIPVVPMASAASSSGPLTVASLLLDLDGSDVYDGRSRVTNTTRNIEIDQTAAQTVNRLERPGQAGVLVQGAGFLGTGVLMDQGLSDDRFMARGLAQGFGLLGTGILFSGGGADAFVSVSDVVRDVSVGGNLGAQPLSQAGWVAWNELQPWSDAGGNALTWRPEAMRSGCGPIHLLPSSIGGMTSDVQASPQEDRFVFSWYDEGSSLPHWSVQHAGLNGCTPTSPTPASRDDTTSNQLHPTFGQSPSGQTEVIWQDDRDGTWSLYVNSLAGTGSDRDRCLIGRGTSDSCTIVSHANETNPYALGDRLVFQTDSMGASHVYLMDLKMRQTTLLSANESGPLPGVHIRPTVSKASDCSSCGLVAWQNWTPPADGWAITVLNLASNATRTLDADSLGLEGGGDLVDPRASKTTLMFTHIPTDRVSQVVKYDWATGQATVVPTGGNEAHSSAVHPLDPGQSAWIQMTPTAGSDEWRGTPTEEVQWDLGTSRETARTRADLHGVLMQGAAWQLGDGILVNQGGNDRYQARQFAQGAAFSTGDTDGSTHAAGGGIPDYNADHGARGLLIDLDGNDQYDAYSAAQGVHVGGTLEQDHSTGSGGDSSPLGSGVLVGNGGTGTAHVETVQNVGLLLDLRGFDQYTAQQQSQGYAALMTGKNLNDEAPDGYSPLVGQIGPGAGQNDALARDAYLLASVGNLIDLGGEDRYEYGRPINIRTTLDNGGGGSDPGGGGSSPVECADIQEDLDDSPLAEFHPVWQAATGDEPLTGLWQLTAGAAWDEFNRTIHEGPNEDVEGKWELLHENLTEFGQMMVYLKESERYPGDPRFEQPDELKDNSVSGIAEFSDFRFLVETDASSSYIAGFKTVPTVSGANSRTPLVALGNVWSGSVNGPYTLLVGTLDQAIRSGAPQQIKDQWPTVEGQWRELENMVFAEEVGPIFPSSIGPIQDPFGGSSGPGQVIHRICEAYTGILPDLGGIGTTGPSEGRNNRAWTQTSRETPENGPTVISPILNPGGVGVDFPIMDQIAQALQNAATASFDVEVEADGPPGMVAGSLSRTIDIITHVEPTGEGTVLADDFYIDFVDVFVDGGWLTRIDDPDPTGTEWSTEWETDDPSFEDGGYSVEAFAHYALRDHSSLGTFGSLKANITVQVDNAPHLLDFRVEAPSHGFSPNPSAGDPIFPTVAYAITPDHPAVDATVAYVDVLDASGDVVKTLRDSADGPIPDESIDLASPIQWDGTDAAGDIVASGEYVVRFNVTDSGDPTDPLRTKSTHQTVLVDSQTPTNGCVRLGQANAAGACNQPLHLVGTSEGCGGAQTDCQVGSIEMTFTLAGEDAARAHVFVDDGTDGWGDWIYTTNLPLVPNNKNKVEWAMVLGDQESKRVLVLFEDRTGNIECMPECGAGGDGLDAAPGGTLLDAMGRKLDIVGDNYTEFVADYVRPITKEVKEPEGTAVVPYLIDEVPHTDKVHRVGPQRDVKIRVGVFEPDDVHTSLRWTSSGVEGGDTILWVDGSNESINRTCPTLTCGGPDSPYHLTWENWTGLNAVEDWPDGLLKWEFIVEDDAGNRPDEAGFMEGTLLYDETKPGLFQEPQVTYHGSDRVTVSARITDAPAGGVAAKPSKFTVLLNVTGVCAETEADCATGLLEFDAPQGDLFRASFPVNHPDLPDLETSGVIRDLDLHFIDEAGNANQTEVRVQLGDPVLGLDLNGTDIGAESVSMNWTTAVPATTALRLQGPDGIEHIIDPLDSLSLATGHNFSFPVLPASRYTYTAESVAADGFRQVVEGALVTRAGLAVDVLHPTKDAAVSGVVPIEGRFQVVSDPMARADVIVRVFNQTDPDNTTKTLLNEVDAGGEGPEHPFTIDWVTKTKTKAVPDGKYTVEVETTYTYQSPAVDEIVVERTTDVRVDNTAPLLTPLDPLPDSKAGVAPSAIRFLASDEGTGIDSGSTVLRIDGRVVDPDRLTIQSSDPPGGETGVVVTIVPKDPSAVFPKGKVRVSLTVQDGAGNIGVTSYSFVHDPDGPHLDGPEDSAVTVAYPLGQKAAAPGNLVRVRIDVEDASAVRSVTMDASPLGGPKELALQEDFGAYITTFKVEKGASVGRVILEAVAEDELGHRTIIAVPIDVVDDAPSLMAYEQVPQSMDSTRLGMAFSRPVELWVRLHHEGRMLLRAPAGPDDLDPSLFPSLGGTDGVYGYSVGLAGLEPGEQYQIVLEVTGEAGHQLTETIDWTFAPITIDPPKITSLNAQAHGGNTIRLSWTPSDSNATHGAVHYHIYREGADGFEQIATTLERHHADHPDAGATYRYFVQSQNLVGLRGTPSEVVPVTLDQQPGVNEWKVTPSRGVEGTPFRFTATVTAANTSQPVAWLVMGDTLYRMSQESGDCRQECTFSAEVRVPVAFRTVQQDYHIEITDGERLLRGPSIGEAPGPRVLLGGPDDQQGPDSSDVDSLPIPAPAIPMTALAMAFAAMMLIRRRNTQ